MEKSKEWTTLWPFSKKKIIQNFFSKFGISTLLSFCRRIAASVGRRPLLAFSYWTRELRLYSINRCCAVFNHILKQLEMKFKLTAVLLLREVAKGYYLRWTRLLIFFLKKCRCDRNCIMLVKYVYISTRSKCLQGINVYIEF